MAKQHPKPDHDPMAGEVDRLLRQLRPEPPPQRPAPTTPPQPRLRQARPRGPRPRPAAPPQAIPRTVATLPSPGGVWARVALAAILLAGVTQWPYGVCGFALAGYFTAVAVALVAGGWAGYASWRRRMGIAHLIAIALIFVGTALAGHQVLVRTGYVAARTTWGCGP